MEIFKDHVKKITSIKTDSRPTNIFPKTKKKKNVEFQESYLLCTLAPKRGGGGGSLVALCPQSSSGT